MNKSESKRSAAQNRARSAVKIPVPLMRQKPAAARHSAPATSPLYRATRRRRMPKLRRMTFGLRYQA